MKQYPVNTTNNIFYANFCVDFVPRVYFDQLSGAAPT